MKRQAVAALAACALALSGACISALSAQGGYIECGACGAHVHDWWYERSEGGELIEVCELCYQDACAGDASKSD